MASTLNMFLNIIPSMHFIITYSFSFHLFSKFNISFIIVVRFGLLWNVKCHLIYNVHCVLLTPGGRSAAAAR